MIPWQRMQVVSNPDPTTVDQNESDGASISAVSPEAAEARLQVESFLDVCPNCGRQDTLLWLDDFVACAACGYSSEGVRGCT